MHVQCCDITYDVTAPFKDVMLENKMTHFRHGVSKVRPPKLPKNGLRIREPQPQYTQGAGCST